MITVGIVNRLARSVSLSMDPAMTSMLSANLRDLFPPSDSNSVNEVSNARHGLFQENVKKKAW